MAELCENIRNFEDMATYYRYTRSAQNIQRYNFTLATTVQLWSCTRTLPSNMRKAVRLPNVGTGIR